MEYIENNNKDITSWTEKYCPKVIGEIIGHTDAVKTIVSWLNSFAENRKNILKKKKNGRKKPKIKNYTIEKEEADTPIDNIDEVTEESEFDKYCIDEGYKSKKSSQPKSCIVITGNHGVGKTCLINAILNSLGFAIQIVNFGKIKTNKNIKEIIENIMNSSDILSMIDGKQKSKIAIVIDELEAITSTMSKNCILALLKNNEENWLFPTIFISNNQHNKLLSDIKKNSYEVRIFPPKDSNLLYLLTKIANKENINIYGLKSDNRAVANQIIEHSQKDFRRLILTLHDLKYVYDSKMITTDMLNEYCKLSNKKDEDFDLFRATNILLQKYSGIDDCIRYYETEKVLLPLMVHQNYLGIINNKSKNLDTSFALGQKISHLLSEGDVIENYIYGEQNWDINEVHGYYTCAAPSYILCNNLPKEEKIRLAFPSYLNKASIGKINKKNIINAGKCFRE